LPRVEEKGRIAKPGSLRQIHHVPFVARPYEHYIRTIERWKVRLEGHCSGIERSYLIIIQVGSNVCAGGIDARDRLYVGCRQIILNQPLFIPGEILSGGSHNEGGLSENGQAIRNVASRPSEFFDQAVYVEAHVKHVNFVGQNVIGKTAWKIHDAVISQGAGNKNGHCMLLFA